MNEKERVYVGQEKIQMKEGQFKGMFGYVRIAQLNQLLLIILENGRKVTAFPDEVEFVHGNYFLVGIEEFKKNQMQK